MIVKFNKNHVASKMYKFEDAKLLTIYDDNENLIAFAKELNGGVFISTCDDPDFAGQAEALGLKAPKIIKEKV